MSKYTANTMLSFHGQVLARAGKIFDGGKLPASVLHAWMEKGWCSPISSRDKARKATTTSSQSKQTDTTI
jgi:hypothetical protein